MLACWIDLLVPYCGDYTEANAWTKEELSKYNHFMKKRKHMEEIENKNIKELITSKEYLNKNLSKYSKGLSQAGILINNVLNENNLWLPTITEAKQLDSSESLSSDVYRDFGIAVYSEGDPNPKIAKRLIQQANKTGLELPILAPFKALSLEEKTAKIGFSEDTQEIITGEQAKQYLNKEFNYQGNSGACGLSRSRGGDWDADWGRLDDSYEDGRVDFVCGKAIRADLEKAHENLLKKQYDALIQTLTNERDQKQENFKNKEVEN